MTTENPEVPEGASRIADLHREAETMMRSRAPAAAASGAAADAQPPVQALPSEPTEAEIVAWMALPRVFGSIIAKALPEVADSYSSEKCREWSFSMVPIGRRYGWNVGAAFEILGLVASTWLLVDPTIEAMRARIAARRARAQQPEKKE